jgi:hypothetical protein
MLDFEASHLLASNASSVVPKELINECGQAGAGTGSSNSGGSNRVSPKYDTAALIQAASTCTDNINRVAALMTAMIENRARGGQSSSQQFTTPVSMSSTPPTKKGLLWIVSTK